ncbi:hypothetical protein ACT691_05290 [Vibrio metschnikovii]
MAVATHIASKGSSQSVVFSTLISIEIDVARQNESRMEESRAMRIFIMPALRFDDYRMSLGWFWK